MMVTHETITDEQIRELCGTGDRDLVRMAQIALGNWIPEGVHPDDHYLVALGARCRCAAAWNARHGGDE